MNPLVKTMHTMKKSIMKFILFLLRNRKHDKPARVQKCNLTEQVNRFLQDSYLFRYNLLTDETEYCPANAADKTFVTIGKRELNTLCLDWPNASRPNHIG
jgi:hypothetical protein